MTLTLVESDHPIIFVYDPAHKKIIVPEHQNGQLVANNETCISVGTRHYLDGPVTVDLVDRASDGLDHMVFEGQLDAPSKKVAICSSEKEGLIELSVKDTVARIKIWVDDTEQPGQVLVEAH